MMSMRGGCRSCMIFRNTGFQPVVGQPDTGKMPVLPQHERASTTYDGDWQLPVSGVA
jgi:hypothetical protein